MNKEFLLNWIEQDLLLQTIYSNSSLVTKWYSLPICSPSLIGRVVSKAFSRRIQEKRREATEDWVKLRQRIAEQQRRHKVSSWKDVRIQRDQYTNDLQKKKTPPSPKTNWQSQFSHGDWLLKSEYPENTSLTTILAFYFALFISHTLKVRCSRC